MAGFLHQINWQSFAVRLVYDRTNTSPETTVAVVREVVAVVKVQVTGAPGVRRT